MSEKSQRSETVSYSVDQVDYLESDVITLVEVKTEARGQCGDESESRDCAVEEQQTTSPDSFRSTTQSIAVKSVVESREGSETAAATEEAMKRLPCMSKELMERVTHVFIDDTTKAAVGISQSDTEDCVLDTTVKALGQTAETGVTKIIHDG